MIKNFFKKPKTEERAKVYSNAGFLSLFENWTLGGYKADPLTIPSAYRAIQIISSQIANTNLKHITDITLNEEVEGSHLSLLLQKPNDDVSPFDQMSSLVMDLLIHGNGYLLKLNKKLYYVPAPSVTLIDNNTIENPISYQITYRSKTFKVSSEDMIHVRNPLTTNDGFYGISPVASFYGVFDTYNGISKGVDTFLNNSVNISGVIETDSVLSAQVVGDLKKNFANAFAGRKNAGKTPVLPNGLKYKQLKPMTDADLKLLEKKGATVEDICLIFGVPKEILGIGEAKYSNMEQIFLAFQNYTLEPIAKAISDEMTLKLIPSYRKDVIVFEFDNLAFASVSDKASAISLLLNSGVLSQNESRKFYGMKTLKNADANKPKNIHEEAIKAKEVSADPSTKDKKLPATDSTQNKSSAYNNSRSLAHMNAEEIEHEIARLKSQLGRVK